MSAQVPSQSGRSDNIDQYRHVFLVRIHQLLKLGYERLDRSVCRAAHEDDISGDLADAIDVVLDDRSQQWMDFFSVHSEAPVRDPMRKGKHRRRVDIRVDSAERRPRTRFPFEAKRLGNGHGVPNYLGEDGLGCFLCGDYARSEDMAGMLGYVQSGETGEWAERIGRTFRESPGEYAIIERKNWRHIPIVEGLEHTYRSSHRRQTVNMPIEIYHTLLDFSHSSSAGSGA